MERTPGTRSGSALITFERVVDLGWFDGRVARWGATPNLELSERASAVSPPSAPTIVADQPSPEAAPKRRRSRSLLAIGFVLIVSGLVVLGNAAFQYWRHEIAVEESQSDLAHEFADRVAAEVLPGGPAASEGEPEVAVISPEAAPILDGGTDIPVLLGPADFGGGASPALEVPDGWAYEPPPEQGEALGRIVIPKIDLDWIVVEGVSAGNLRQGPGHMPGTAMPGQLGNAVLSGHRTTYGKPFKRLDLLVPGDRFTVETLIGVHVYEVVSTEIVLPRDMWVTTQWEGSWLTLTTCHPLGSSRERLIVFSKLIDGPNEDAIRGELGVTYDPPEPPA